MDISADSEVVHVHDTSNSKGIWIAVTLFSVMALICLWYFWRSTAANTSEQRRTSSTKVSLRLGASDPSSLHRHHQKSLRREEFHHLENMILDVSIELHGDVRIGV